MLQTYVMDHAARHWLENFFYFETKESWYLDGFGNVMPPYQVGQVLRARVQCETCGHEDSLPYKIKVESMKEMLSVDGGKYWQIRFVKKDEAK